MKFAKTLLKSRHAYHQLLITIPRQLKNHPPNPLPFIPFPDYLYRNIAAITFSADDIHNATQIGFGFFAVDEHGFLNLPGNGVLNRLLYFAIRVGAIAAYVEHEADGVGADQGEKIFDVGGRFEEVVMVLNGYHYAVAGGNFGTFVDCRGHSDRGFMPS